MTQPTGEHATGVELISGYVKVDVRTDGGMQKLHTDLDAVEAHAKLVGANSAKNIVEAVGAAGDPAAKALTDKLSEGTSKRAPGIFASFLSGMKDGLAQTNVGDEIARNIVANAKKGTDEAAPGIVASFITGIRQGLEQHREELKREAIRASIGLKDGFDEGASSISASIAKKLDFGAAREKLSGVREGLEGVGISSEGALSKVGFLGAGVLGLASAISGPMLVAGAVAAVGIATGVVVERLYELGEKWEVTFHNLQIQTGATGQQLKGLEETTKNVAGNVPLSISQVGGIVAAVSTSFKDTGAGIGEVATELGKLQSMVGQIDTTTLGRGFRAFDIGGDAKAQVEVLNELFKASQDTQIPINNLITTFTKAAPVAKEFKLNIGQTVAVMAQFDQAGVNPASTLFTLSRAANEATKNHKDFATVLQDEITQIKNAATEQDKAALATKFFGPTSGRGGAGTMLQAINEGFTLDPATLNQIAQAGDLIDKTREQTMTWGDTWTETKNKISGALEPLSTSVRELVDRDLEGLAAWITAHQAGIVQFFAVVAKAGAAMVEGLVKVVSAVAHIFGDLETTFGHLVTFIGRAMSDIGGAMSHLPTWLGGGDWTRSLENAGHDVMNFGDKMTNNGKTITDWGVNLRATSSQIIPQAFGAINKAVDETNNKTKDATDKFVGLGQSIEHLNDVKPKPIQVKVDAVPGQGVQLSPDQKSVEIVMGVALGAGVPGGPAAGAPAPSSPPSSFAGPFAWPTGVPRQTGGDIPGFGGGDTVPAWLEPGEHVFTKEDVRAAGGHGNVYKLRSLIRQGLLNQSSDDSGGVARNLPGDPYHKPRTNLPPVPWVPGNFNPSMTIDTSMIRMGNLPADYLKELQLGAGAPRGPHGQPKDVQDIPNWLPGYASGGRVRPAGIPHRERGWVQDMYRLSKPGKGFQDGGEVFDIWNRLVSDMSTTAWGGSTIANWLGGTNHNPTWAIRQGLQAPQKIWQMSHLGDLTMAMNRALGGWSGGGPVGYQTGGEVAAIEVLQAESGRTPYQLGGFSPSGIDCSGLVSEVVNAFLGTPAYSTGDRMATGSEAGWLTRKGFVKGVGPPGTLRVGFYNGGVAGGHTALTLPSGINAESGGSGGGVRLGGGAAGADNPEFTEHYYLPVRSVVQPGGYGGTGSGGSGGYGGAGGSGGGASSSGPSQAEIAGLDTKVSTAQGKLDVANQKLQEAIDKPITGKTEKAREHEQAAKDAEVTRLRAERDRLQDDLGSATEERAGAVGDTDPKAMVAAKDRITEANQRLHDAEAKLATDRADPKKKPSDITADENAIAAAKERVGKAEDHLQKLQDAPAKKGKGETKDQRAVDPFEQFGGIAQKALQENLPPGFSDPSQWGVVKSGAGLLKFFGSLAGAHGDKGAAGALTTFGDVLSGSGTAVGKDLSTLIAGGTPGMRQSSSDLVTQTPGFTPPSNPTDTSGANGGGGNTVNIDRSTNYSGPITDADATQRATDAVQRRNLQSDIQQPRMAMQ